MLSDAIGAVTMVSTTAVASVADLAEMTDASSVVGMAVHSVASLVDELVASMDELPVGWMVVVMAASSDACSVARWVGR